MAAIDLSECPVDLQVLVNGQKDNKLVPVIKDERIELDIDASLLEGSHLVTL
mgnify:CR=1 FL=1